MIESELLLPDTDDPELAPFWAGCAQGELLVQACGACGRWRMPPRPMCPACRSTEVTWDASNGRGLVWSFNVAHPPLLPAYAELAPYNTIIVELEQDSDIRFVGNLIEHAGAPINSVDPATIAIGEPVSVIFDKVADDVHLPRWVRASTT